MQLKQTSLACSVAFGRPLFYADQGCLTSACVNN